ncbi:MAG: ATP-binding protein [Kofleriaceae bacterium]
MNTRIAAQIRFTRALTALRSANTEEAAQKLVTELEAAREEIQKANDASEKRIVTKLGLSGSEAAVLVLLACASLDRRTRQQIETNFACELNKSVIRELVYGENFGPSSLEELSATGRLRRLGLIERAGGDMHEDRCRWSISERALGWLCGDTRLDGGVAELAVRRNTVPRSSLVVRVNNEEVTAVTVARRSLVLCIGARGLGRRSLLIALAAESGTEMLPIDASRLATDILSLERQLGDIGRECKLLNLAPLFCDIDTGTAEQVRSRVELIEKLAKGLDSNVYMTCANRAKIRWSSMPVVVELRPLSGSHIQELWRGLIPDASESDADYLATQYPLLPALMHHAAEAVKARALGREITPEDFKHGIRAVLDDRLGDYAKRVDATQDWKDLVIEEEQGQAIGELIARIRQRRTVYEQWGFAKKVGKGLGVAALFSGPPGTGKTMVAALIAKELGLELYQVDMAKITSKYIGETEKHLAEMFDAAEAGHAILLFDEADSLFGKRTEVRSSNDRYANLETNYLLQRMESFTGICLLTSNHESNIDPAFQRRLSLHLRFQVPDADERAKLWRAMLPEQAPVDADVDFAGLGRRFEMTGGYIRNAALRAAFLAADEGTSISEAHLEHAARMEYDGMGKIAAPSKAQQAQQASAWPPAISSSL